MSSFGSQPPMNLMEKDPALQWKWHETYRDQAKNMYRTSYTDMTHFREVYVRSDFPAGYGGHIPSMRHDVLFRNTEFDRKASLMRQDPSRDALPSFTDQLSGIPTYTKYPCGAKKNPSHKVCLHDGTTKPLAPWGITVNPHRESLDMRHVPPTMKKSSSMPGLHNRSNSAARGVGGMMAGASPAGGDAGRASTGQLLQAAQAYEPIQPRHHRGSSTPTSGRQPGGHHLGGYDANGGEGGMQLSPGGERLRRTVDFANEEAMRGRMPTEAEILHEQMHQ